MGISAAFFAACGSGTSGGGAATNSDGSASDRVAKVADTSSKAKRGGVLKDYAQAEPRSLDPVQPLADLNRISAFIYNTLLGAKPGHLKPATGELQGSLAQSWEVAPDGLTLTFKLRPGVKWHNKAPVNGRLVDTKDILFSMERYAQKGRWAPWCSTAQHQARRCSAPPRPMPAR